MLNLMIVSKVILPAVVFSILLLLSMAGTASADDPYLGKSVISIENYSLVYSESDVLVAFIQGDSRQPFVIGSFWNDDERPPLTKTEDSDE